MTLESFCLAQIARMRERLNRLEQSILRRRSSIDFRNERWFWMTMMAAIEADESTETRYVDAIASDGTVVKKRIRPRWYWRERSRQRQLDPEYRIKKASASRARRLRRKVAESMRSNQVRPTGARTYHERGFIAVARTAERGSEDCIRGKAFCFD